MCYMSTQTLHTHHMLQILYVLHAAEAKPSKMEPGLQAETLFVLVVLGAIYVWL